MSRIVTRRSLELSSRSPPFSFNSNKKFFLHYFPVIDEEDSFLKAEIDEAARRELDPRTNVLDYDEIVEFGQYIGIGYESAVDILLGAELNEAIEDYHGVRAQGLKNLPDEPDWFSKKGSRGQRWYPVPANKSVGKTPHKSRSSPNVAQTGQSPEKVKQEDDLNQSNSDLVTNKARRIDRELYENILEDMGEEIVAGKWGSLGISEYKGMEGKRNIVEEEIPTMMERESFPEKQYVLYKDPEKRIIAGVRKAEPLVFFDNFKELEANLESLLEQ